jgi:hypothetical protein
MTSSLTKVQRPSLKLASTGIKNPFNGASPMLDEPRSGDICPSCREARLDYNGLLNLGCSKCGYALRGLLPDNKKLPRRGDLVEE